MKCAKKKKLYKEDKKESEIIYDQNSQKIGWLEYEIKISKNKTLQLTLTIDNYKQEFIQFIKRNNLSKPNAMRIKQLIKQRLDEELSKVQNKKEYQLIQYQQQSGLENRSKYEVNVTWGEQHHQQLFQSQIYQLQQNHHSNQQPQTLWHQQFSSIHQLNNLSSSSNDNNKQQQQMLSQSQPTRSQLMMKEYQKMKINWKEKMKFFRLDDDQQNNNDGMGLMKMARNHDIKMKQKVKIIKPMVKKKVSVKKQIKPLTQRSPIKPKTSNQNRSPIKSQSPPIIQKHLKLQNNQQQSLLNQQVFHRLHNHQTYSFKQKHSNYQPQQQKQLIDQQTISKYNFEQARQFQHLTHKEKMQIFYNLHNTSTASSMNKQYDHLSDNYYRQNNENNYYGVNQIQNVINLTANNNHSKRLPNLNSRVYQTQMQKRCNQHCQQFSQLKRISHQKKLTKQKEKRIRDQLRSKSKDSLEINQRTKHKVKRNGECLCCQHKQIEKQRLQKEKNERIKQRSYTSKTKYSIEKLFPPYNHVSFISDVLQQSYNQLFPEK